MRLSVVFELLLIFVLVAFAASKSVGKKSVQTKRKNGKQENDINKYCKCNGLLCNCCREFQIPLVNVNGPGCASLQYLQGDRMAISVSFGNKLIANRTVSGSKPKPVCMPIPGGVSKFCGRVYNIARKEEDFRACLGLELQSKSTVEAAVRVSCFNFGAKGVTSEPADPLPLATEQDNDNDDDDDDDDEDTFGLTDDDDDDDFEDDDDDDEDDDAAEAENDVDPSDYGGFSIIGEDLLGGIFGSTSGNKKKPNKKKQIAITPVSSTTTKRTRTRRTTTTTTRKPTSPRVTRRPSRRPSTARPNRPTRTPRPPRRTTTKPTSALPISSESLNNLDSQKVEQPTSVILQATSSKPIQNNIQDKLEDSSENYLEPVVIVTQKPTKRPSVSTFSLTTQKSNHVTSIDPGIQLSLADITGQLSEMPVTTIVSTSKAVNRGEFAAESQNIKPLKVEAVTKKQTTPLMFTSPVDDEMIEIVESFDEEDKKDTIPEEDELKVTYVENDDDEISEDSGEQLPEIENDSELHKSENKQKKNKRKENDDDEDDDDLLGLSLITDTLGITGGKKNKNKLSKDKVEHPTTTRNLKKEDDDDDDFLGLGSLSETLGFRTIDKKKDKKHKKRQNKMMRGDWYGLDTLVRV